MSDKRKLDRGVGEFEQKETDRVLGTSVSMIADNCFRIFKISRQLLPVNS